MFRPNIIQRDKEIEEILDPQIYVDTDIRRHEILIPNNYRTSSSIMTHAEYTRIICERAKQIENNSLIFVNIVDESDPVSIAKKEIEQKKCPLEIIRYMTNNKKFKEIWQVNEMIVPFK